MAAGVIFDTGTSYIGVPSYGFSVFENYMSSKATGGCHITDGLLACDCSGLSFRDFDELVLVIGDSRASFTARLAPEAYLALVLRFHNSRAMIPVW